MLPTFVGIGPGRTGTSMLYEVLCAHPEVHMARGTKETNYFSHEYHRGLAWYEAFFTKDAGIRAVGEISNAYFYDAAVPARIAEALPDVRLFTCLRNPFDRLRSVYSYRKRAGRLLPDLTLDDAVRRYDDLVEDNCYATKLRAYFRHVDRQQLLILFYDDLIGDPERFIEQLFAFIGVAVEFRPDVLYERVNASAAAWSPRVGALASDVAEFLRQRGMLRALDWAKRSRLIRRAVLRPVGSQEPAAAPFLQEDTRARLLEAWGSEIEQVERWTGRSLGHWLDPS